MILASEICGRFELDVYRMLSEIRRMTSEVYTQTARLPCSIDLHPDDARDMARHMFGPQAKAGAITAIGGTPVQLDHSGNRRRGVALVRQCELPHTGGRDCVYLRLRQTPPPVTVTLPGQDPFTIPHGELLPPDRRWP